MTPAAPDPDGSDLLALQGGERRALDRLMARWERPLRGFLYRWTQNEADAADLAQETFVRVYRHCGRFRPGATFSTWMFQIALNLARDHDRRRKRRPTVALALVPEAGGEATPKSALADQERAAAVRAAIAGLPADLREAVLLFEYEDKSHAEIAAIAGVTPKAVETRLYRARAQLRQVLKRWLE
ncbi:MAG: sigma-70 family RNA polymerase sigma factor [Opitutaceae bacterium]|nr:sigma-70 family RNA polymerase sigma factor [Opitutaceae bacterium]